MTHSHKSGECEEWLPLVFSFLSLPERLRAGAASKAWAKAFYAPRSWRRIVLDGINKDAAMQNALNLLQKNCEGNSNNVEELRKQTRDLQMQFAHAANDHVIGILARLFPTLESINLDGSQNISSVGLVNMAHSCKGLHSLSLYWIPRMEDTGVISMISSSAHLITRLCLSGCKHLTNEVGFSIGSHLPNLVHLDLTRVNQITDEGIVAIAQGCPKLLQLIMYASCCFTDRAVLAVAEHCKSLQKFDIAGNSHITDAAFTDKQHRFHNLWWLNLSWCVSLTDATLFALGEGCPNLSALFVLGNRCMTDQGMQAVSKGCRGMRSIDVQGCTGMTARSMEALSPLFPSLRYVARLGDAPNYK